MARDLRFEPLSMQTQDRTRQLILAGLAEHWGELDPSLNPDLDDMLTSYASGQTIVAFAPGSDELVGTGTLLPRSSNTAEIVRMSVAPDQRRTGLGRAIVAHLESLAKEAGIGRVILETTSAWTEVVAFYVSCGYAITHTEQDDFGENTWFEKRLTS